LFEEHRPLITSVIRKNRTLLFALRLEYEDVSQQLSIAMLSAIRKFDPDKSPSLAAHIRCSLQFEILNIKRIHKPFGITGVPKGHRLDFMCLDNIGPDGSVYELATNDDVTAIEFSEFFDSLSEHEAYVVDLAIQGYRPRRKEHTSALNKARQQYTSLFSTPVMEGVCV
jgi:hypothetical protein